MSPSRLGEIVTRDQTFRANNGATFAVESGFDYHGDHKTVNANNLHDCINICSTQAACLAVSYAATGKSCWLKSTVNAAIAKNKVSGAVRLHYVSVSISCPTDGLNWIKGAFIFPIYKSLTLARVS